VTDEQDIKEPEDLAVEPEPQEQPADAVIVIKTTDENGNLRPVIQTSGGVQITEVQFLLEAGIQVFRKELGFDG